MNICKYVRDKYFIELEAIGMSKVDEGRFLSNEMSGNAIEIELNNQTLIWSEFLLLWAP